jgi:hypothetical protein
MFELLSPPQPARSRPAAAPHLRKVRLEQTAHALFVRSLQVMEDPRSSAVSAYFRPLSLPESAKIEELIETSE